MMTFIVAVSHSMHTCFATIDLESLEFLSQQGLKVAAALSYNIRQHPRQYQLIIIIIIIITTK